MNTIETLTSRKSIRSFTGEQISSDELALLLKAANAAPVAMGQYDGVHLTIIQNAELLQKIDAAGAAMFGKPDMHPLYGAPTLILISTKTPASGGENVAFSNTAIISHNIVLEAVELGIGACYIWGGQLLLLQIINLLCLNLDFLKILFQAVRLHLARPMKNIQFEKSHKTVLL